MAKYKGIQGYTVQSLSSDPTASSDTEGQLWYNNSTGKFKVAATGAGTWASGGDMGTARYYMGIAGDKSAMLLFGGGPGQTAVTESYNGTAWTEVNDLNTARDMIRGCGTQTAALSVAGNVHPVLQALTEKWDGTSWTESGDINTARRSGNAMGTTTTAIYCGGYSGPPNSAPGWRNETESYDGTSWTEVNDMNTARFYSGGAGAFTSALVFGGFPPGAPGNALTESWNGTSWTEVNDLSTGVSENGGAGTATSSVLSIGGGPVKSAVEKFDGTSWAASPALATARWAQGGSSCGPTGACMVAGGIGPAGLSATTEEFTDPVYTVKTVTVS